MICHDDDIKLKVIYLMYLNFDLSLFNEYHNKLYCDNVVF